MTWNIGPGQLEGIGSCPNKSAYVAVKTVQGNKIIV